MNDVNEVVDALELVDEVVPTGTMSDEELDATNVGQAAANLTGNLPTEPTSEPVTEVPVVTEPPSKMSIAKTIFARIKNATPDAPRKTYIQAFINEAGLTKAGAATYYQKLTAKK